MITLLSEQDDSALAEFQVKILSLAKDGNAPGIVIDISALEIVDRYMAKVLADTSRMAGLLGIGTMVVGVKPAVAASLVALGHDSTAFKTAISLEAAIQMLIPAPMIVEDDEAGREDEDFPDDGFQTVNETAEEPEDEDKSGRGEDVNP